MSYVFVWNSYGSTQVFSGDTKEDVLAIINEMNGASEAVGEETVDLEKISEQIDKIGLDKMREKINVTVHQIACQSDDDRFEYGSGFHSIIKNS